MCIIMRTWTYAPQSAVKTDGDCVGVKLGDPAKRQTERALGERMDEMKEAAHGWNKAQGEKQNKIDLS